VASQAITATTGSEATSAGQSDFSSRRSETAQVLAGEPHGQRQVVRRRPEPGLQLARPALSARMPAWSEASR
jgi:hypothetical protein